MWAFQGWCTTRSNCSPSYPQCLEQGRCNHCNQCPTMAVTSPHLGDSPLLHCSSPSTNAQARCDWCTRLQRVIWACIDLRSGLATAVCFSSFGCSLLVIILYYVYIININIIENILLSYWYCSPHIAILVQKLCIIIIVSLVQKLLFVVHKFLFSTVCASFGCSMLLIILYCVYIIILLI